MDSTEIPDTSLDEVQKKQVVDEFYREGVAPVRGFLAPDECAALRQRTDEIFADSQMREASHVNGGVKVLKSPVE